MKRVYVSLVMVAALLLFPSLGRSEEGKGHGRCHIGPSVELMMSSIPSLRIGGGLDLTCRLQSRLVTRFGADILVGFLRQFEGGISLFSSLEVQLPRKWWFGLGVLAVKMLDTPTVEFGGGPVLRVQPKGMPLLGFVLMAETEFPVLPSKQGGVDEEPSVILKGGVMVNF